MLPSFQQRSVGPTDRGRSLSRVSRSPRGRFRENRTPVNRPVSRDRSSGCRERYLSSRSSWEVQVGLVLLSRSPLRPETKGSCGVSSCFGWSLGYVELRSRKVHVLSTVLQWGCRGFLISPGPVGKTGDTLVVPLQTDPGSGDGGVSGEPHRRCRVGVGRCWSPYHRPPPHRSTRTRIPV